MQLATRHDVDTRAKGAHDVEHGAAGVCLEGVMQAMRNAIQRLVEPLIPIADGRGAIHVRRRARGSRNARKRNALAMQLAADAGKAGLQYAFAQTASATEGRPHLRQLRGGSADWNSSSGSTRIVALVSSLIVCSHSSDPQKPAYTKPPGPSI